MSYQPKIYRKQGGNEMVFAAGSTTLLKPVVPKGVNYTVTREDSGAIFYATAADVVFTLPATEAGLEFTFIVGVASGATGVAISPAAVDKLTGRGIATPADDKDLINTGATDVVGDSVTIRGDGVDGWYVVDSEGIWAREA